MSYQTVRDYKGDIPQFQAQRTNPIYEYITRKFYCQENIVGNVKDTKLTQLSYNIHTPQDDFVWKSVKLHIPLKITAKSSKDIVSMRLADRNPACNVALSACPMKMFTDCQCVINGTMFSVQPNFYEGILDTCYQSRNETSWMSSHSLKPNANRNLRKETETNGIYPVHDAGTFDHANIDQSFVQIHDGTSSVSDHAFDLTFANPGFNSRVRSFQTDLQGSASYCETEIVSYLHIGPFMRRVRKLPNQQKQYNTAVPFVKDFSLRLVVDKTASEYDIQKGNAYNEDFPGRQLASSILEWGTPCNMRHVGENEMPDVNWADYYDFEITSKPFLEVEYVKLGNQNLANSYKLRAITYQHEKSDPFSFNFPIMNNSTDRLVASTVPVRINSRLLEVCSKVYLWCELSQAHKKSFFLGGTQRCARIDNLHLRINNRSDILFEPTQLSLFDNFKKLTSNAWGLSTWEKSPIYVFDPATFGLQEYLSGQSQLMTYEWNMDCTPTELMIEEFMGLETQRARKSMGYIDNIVFNPIAPNTWEFAHVFDGVQVLANIRKYMNWVPSPGNTAPDNAQPPINQPTAMSSRKLFIPTANSGVSPHQTQLWMEFTCRRNNTNAEGQGQLYVQSRQGKPLTQVWGDALKNYVVKPRDPTFANHEEIWRIKKVTGHRVRFDGFIWALVDINSTGANGVQDFPLVDSGTAAGAGNGILWYVPESYPFSLSRDNYQKTTGESGLYYNPKRIFNSLSDYDFATNTWAAGKLPVWNNDGPGAGFITGEITQLLVDGTAPVTLPFNAATPFANSAVIPGMRAYPLEITNNAVVGIRNHGDVDGGPYQQAGLHYVVRGGQRPTPNAVQQADPRFMYNSQALGAVNNQDHHKWIAFQLSADAHTGANANLNGTFIPSAGSATQATASGVSVGDIQDYIFFTDNHRVIDSLGFEVHMMQCVVERNIFNSRTDNNWADYGYQEGTANNPPTGAYGLQPRFGQRFGSSAMKAANNTESNSLQFETNVLYEFGQKSYIIERDGKMAEDYPGISVNENLVQGRSFVKDKRGSDYQNQDARDILGAFDEMNIQG